MKLTKSNLKKFLKDVTDNDFIDQIYDGLKKGLYLGYAHKNKYKYYNKIATSIMIINENKIEYTLNELNINGLYLINFIKKEVINLLTDDKKIFN